MKVKKMSEIRLIDANALIDDYRVCGADCKDYRDCSGHVVMCDSARFRQAINDQPTVEAEPIKTAHWTFKEKDREMLEDGQIPYNMWCSYCGAWHDNDDYDDNYCSCCGAKIGEDIEYADI